MSITKRVPPSYIFFLDFVSYNPTTKTNYHKGNGNAIHSETPDVGYQPIWGLRKVILARSVEGV